MNSSTFYEVLDIIEEYDTAITQVNQLFGNAMLDLAYIKFINPYSSISTSGFQPTPALLRFDENTKKLVFTDSNQFVKKVNPEEFEQYEQQEDIEASMKKLFVRQDLNETEKITSRFGSISNSTQIVKASQSFRRCLDKLINFAHKKEKLLEKLKEIEQNKTKQNNQQKDQTQNK